MKIQNTTAINNNTYTFSELYNGRTIGLYTATDVSNCKLSYIHGIGSLAIVSEQERKAIIDGLLNESKGCVILNTTNEVVANFIKNTYPIYYFHKIPIGYGRSYHYHICIKNTVKLNNSCRDPEVVNQPIAVEQHNNKVAIADKLLNILRKKRRKTDWVTEFIDTL